MSAVHWSVRDNEIHLKGELTFHTVNDLLAASESLLKNDKRCWQCDLSQITHVDSAGLALLLEWLKQLKQYNCELVVRHAPLQLQAMVQLSGLQSVLAMS